MTELVRLNVPLATSRLARPQRLASWCITSSRPSTGVSPSWSRRLSGRARSFLSWKRGYTLMSTHYSSRPPQRWLARLWPRGSKKKGHIRKMVTSLRESDNDITQIKKHKSFQKVSKSQRANYITLSLKSYLVSCIMIVCLAVSSVYRECLYVQILLPQWYPSS